MPVGLTDVRLTPVGVGDGLAPQPAGYLTMLDSYRVVVCAGVAGQHSFLWTGMTGNVVGTAFITILRYTRYAFFLLSALVIRYAQITRPRSLWAGPLPLSPGCSP